jgi:hypothetical protein
METNKLTAEEVYDLFESQAKMPICLVFYLQKADKDCEMKISSLPIQFRPRESCIAKIQSIMNEASFVSWYGLDKLITETDASVVDAWYAQWKF